MVRSKMVRWAGHVVLLERRGMHIDVWWESQKEKTTKKIKCKWVDNNKMDFGEIGWGGMDWIDLALARD
jgi:hypothetical protein